MVVLSYFSIECLITRYKLWNFPGLSTTAGWWNLQSKWNISAPRLRFGGDTRGWVPFGGRRTARTSKVYIQEMLSFAPFKVLNHPHPCLVVNNFCHSQTRTRRGFSGLLLFRRAAIVIMASNRLKAYGLISQSKKRDALVLTEFPRKGKKAILCLGRKEAAPSWMKTGGNSPRQIEDKSIMGLESRLTNW